MNSSKTIHYNPKLKEFARRLRNNSTQSEIKLWQYLRGKQMLGYDFHRQKPVDEYIVDFYCPKLQLAIELDGYTHLLDDVQTKDENRTNILNQLGIKIIRYWDDEVMNDIQNVLMNIEGEMKEREIELKNERIHTPDPSF